MLLVRHATLYGMITKTTNTHSTFNFFLHIHSLLFFVRLDTVLRYGVWKYIDSLEHVHEQHHTHNRLKVHVVYFNLAEKGSKNERLLSLSVRYFSSSCGGALFIDSTDTEQKEAINIPYC